MGRPKISQKEAERLLNMLKRTLVREVSFPQKRKNEEFRVIGDTKKDEFTVNIFRGSIRRDKYNLNARVTKNGRVLLQLHINPSNVHYNPNGEKITGSHWHIYTEEHELGMAIPAENIESERFIETTMLFLEEFNVVEKPNIIEQIEFV